MADKQPVLKDLHMTIREYYDRLRQRNAVPPDSFGLELEMEGLKGMGISDFMDAFGNTTGWAIHDDGSLRSGLEFVSSVPRAFEDLESDLVRLNRKLDRKELFAPDFSLRTSVHVHMNVQDLTWLQVINLFVLYLMYEQALIEFGGEERNGNVHCLSGLDAQSTVEIMRRALIADIEPENAHIRTFGRNVFRGVVQQLTDRGRRYSALNFAAIPVFGTLEFRTHRGTRDTNTIMEWVTILRKLRIAAARYSNPQEIVADFSSKGHVRLAEEVWEGHPRLLGIVYQQRQQCWLGMRLAQEIAFSRANWKQTEVKAKTKVDKTLPLTGVEWGFNLINEAQAVNTPAPPAEEQLERIRREADQRRAELMLRIAREQRRLAERNRQQ